MFKKKPGSEEDEGEQRRAAKKRQRDEGARYDEEYYNNLIREEQQQQQQQQQQKQAQGWGDCAEKLGMEMGKLYHHYYRSAVQEVSEPAQVLPESGEKTETVDEEREKWSTIGYKCCKRSIFNVGTDKGWGKEGG